MRAVLEVQQKTGLKNALLEKRIQTLTLGMEKKDAVIGELTAMKEVPKGINEKFDVSNIGLIQMSRQYNKRKILV